MAVSNFMRKRLDIIKLINAHAADLRRQYKLQKEVNSPKKSKKLYKCRSIIHQIPLPETFGYQHIDISNLASGEIHRRNGIVGGH